MGRDLLAREPRHRTKPLILQNLIMDGLERDGDDSCDDVGLLHTLANLSSLRLSNFQCKTECEEW